MADPLADLRPLCTIDAHDCIASANVPWARLVAPRAQAGEVLNAMVGRPIWELTPAGEVRHLSMFVYRRVRAVGARVFVPMRVDLPEQRRLVDIELRPLRDGSIAHVFELVWNESRAAVALLDPAYPRDERTLRRCWWCNRIQVGAGMWEEIETAQVKLDIPALATLPQVVAASCPPCRQAVLSIFPMQVA